jgi:hypothetical protein
MTKITSRQRVNAPLGSAKRLLLHYLSGHPGPDGAARITLRAGGLERAAVVTLTPAHRPQDMEPRFAVHWEAEAGGPYPAFNGTLAVGGAEDYDAFSLDLDGDYEPPLGVAGKAFDMVVGHRIADATVRELLVEIQRAIEAQFQAEEAAKPHS